MTQTIRRQIWCLWEPEGTLPSYLQLCLRTVERNAGVPVTLLAPRDVEALAPDLDPSLAMKVRRLGQRSDYYRSHLLAAQGGMWLDVDSVVVSDVNWAFDGAAIHGLASRRNRIGISTTPLIAPAGSPTMHRWIDLQEEVLRALKPGADLLPWTALGATTLTEAVGNDPFFELPRPRVAPLPWTQADSYMSRFTRPDAVLRPEASVVNLYNERFPTWLKKATEDELLASPVMLARLLRIALGQSKLEDERRRLDAAGASAESMGRFSAHAFRRAHRLVKRLRSTRRSRQPRAHVRRDEGI